ncbi:endonuclease-reverse transcriptase [Plakobranchus ocellatus]|uniref:Endonuclease-reverse transcriptase n=1 Tax=Plakobranchus ocellatus TaxID=259542 RepID=A0AAV4DKR3_9GAST|nr:endonuclease-reverse transcriptase [Plakobranchus ocellatus]
MSAAFDTINRTKLLEILRDIIDEDELHIIRFLLSETTIDVKINGANDPMPFTTNIGTPQGDSLSPALFIVYLEHALRDIRPVQNDKQESIPAEIIYADDIDFIGKKDADVNSIEKTLKTHCLKVNVDKTEHTSVRKDSEDWKTTKKVGSLLGSKEDIEHRKHLSKIAFNKLTNIWKSGNKTKQKTKIKLYNSLVKSMLLYNCGTWALTKTDEDRLDSFHRKQLINTLGIRYPTIISNASLHKKCREAPLSMQVLEARWRLFGHVLRRDRNIPANKAMLFYFSDNKRARGRPQTTLPITLNNDLKKLVATKLELTIQTDLDTLRLIAEDRPKWNALVVEIRKTAEAARSDDPASGRL